MLERPGFRPGKEFFLRFSPERVDPGNTKYHRANFPKVVGGTTPASTEVAALSYSQAVETVLPVSSTHKILVIASCVLKTGAPYRELGGDYFDKLNPADRPAYWSSNWSASASRLRWHHPRP
jgi:hypothetical protein